MSEHNTEAATEPVIECSDCSRTWTVADVEAVLAAKKSGNGLLLAAIGVLVVGVFAAVGIPLVGIPILVLGFGLGVWSVIINRKPLRTMTTVTIDRHNKQELKKVQRKTLGLARKVVWSSPWVMGYFLYFAISRGIPVALVLLLPLVLCGMLFAIVGIFQQRFQRRTKCPGCLDLRVTINFLPADKTEAIQQLRAME